METLNLSSSEVAVLMGVNRPTIDEWLLNGVPSEHAAKLRALTEIADILDYRLRDGLAPDIVRRPADAYGGRTMLEVIANGEHEWLLQNTKDRFNSDFNTA